MKAMFSPGRRGNGEGVSALCTLTLRRGRGNESFVRWLEEIKMVMIMNGDSFPLYATCTRKLECYTDISFIIDSVARR